MQLHPAPHSQLPLFEAFLAQPMPLPLQELAPAFQEAAPEVFSELSLRGAAGNCLTLLAPVLRELSERQDARWLTLIAPPSCLTRAWMRDAGLNRERILLLHPNGNQSALELTRQALRLGRSHTVASWLNPLGASTRKQLMAAARAGNAQSLNIRLG